MTSNAPAQTATQTPPPRGIPKDEHGLPILDTPGDRAESLRLAALRARDICRPFTEAEAQVRYLVNRLAEIDAGLEERPALEIPEAVLSMHAADQARHLRHMPGWFHEWRVAETSQGDHLARMRKRLKDQRARLDFAEAEFAKLRRSIPHDERAAVVRGRIEALERELVAMRAELAAYEKSKIDLPRLRDEVARAEVELAGADERARGRLAELEQLRDDYQRDRGELLELREVIAGQLAAARAACSDAEGSVRQRLHEVGEFRDDRIILDAKREAGEIVTRRLAADGGARPEVAIRQKASGAA